MNPQQQYPQMNGMPTGQPMQAGQPSYFNTAPTPVATRPSQQSVPQPQASAPANRKLVDYLWQRIAICSMVIAGGMLIAVFVAVIIANVLNGNVIQRETQLSAANDKLQEIYKALNVESHEAALVALGNDEMLTGSDIQQIRAVLAQKYGDVTSWDTSDASINMVKVNGIYKVASLKMTNAAGTARALVYAKKSDNQWIAAAYNAADEKNPCKDSTEEEKKALAGIVSCPTVVPEEDEEE